jgi:hypothetical protein
MAIIRRVFGPFGFHEEHPGTQAHELRWGFIGIRGDRTTAHWNLIFKVDGRKFVVGASQPCSGWRNTATMTEVNKALPQDYPVETAHPDAFLDGRPVETGRIVDILKKRLTPADIARCTAAAIARR